MDAAAMALLWTLNGLDALRLLAVLALASGALAWTLLLHPPDHKRRRRK